jgi:ketosteroid isomerase-like protein
MKLSYPLLAFLLIHHFCQGQNNHIQNEINTHVWRPFIESFSNGNDSLFASVHSQDVARVIIDDQTILNHENYFKPKTIEMKKSSNAWKKSIELRFLKRIATSDQAYEVGYYKTTYTQLNNGELSHHFGKFTVLVRKEKGVWKILMDSDAQDGVSEDIFLQGQPMDKI